MLEIMFSLLYRLVSHHNHSAPVSTEYLLARFFFSQWKLNPIFYFCLMMTLCIPTTMRYVTRAARLSYNWGNTVLLREGVFVLWFLGQLISHPLVCWCFHYFRFLPHVGIVTIIMNDYPKFKVGISDSCEPFNLSTHTTITVFCTVTVLGARRPRLVRPDPQRDQLTRLIYLWTALLHCWYLPHCLLLTID